MHREIVSSDSLTDEEIEKVLERTRSELIADVCRIALKPSSPAMARAARSALALHLQCSEIF